VDSGELSPLFMPVVAATLGLLAIVFMLMQAARGDGLLPRANAMTRSSWQFVGAALSVMAIGFSAMALLGYLPGGAAIVLGFMAIGRADFRIVLASAVALPLLLWLLFSQLLGFPLP
jgi:hypothetical protein